jgi:hypothetical protein
MEVLHIMIGVYIIKEQYLKITNMGHYVISKRIIKLEKLLNMDPKERRELGIDKSTLFRIRERIKAGKKFRLYKKIKNKLS